MDTNQMFSLMDILMLAAGAYLLYAWYLLMFKNEIKEGVLIQKDSFKKCKDIEGYKKYIGPKLFVLVICALLSGGIGLYSDYVQQVNSTFYLILTVVFFVILIWFATRVKKAESMFF